MQKTHAMRRTLALVLGVLAGSVALEAIQSNKITPTGFAICLDFPQRDVVLTGKFDGSSTGVPLTATWSGTAAPFTATVAISTFPASARSVGVHTVIVSAPDGSEVLADNTTLPVPSMPTTVTYQVVSTTGQGFSNVKLIRVTSGGRPSPGALKR